MKSYCDIDDVLGVAVDLRSSVVPESGDPTTFNTQSIQRSEVTDIIAEASEMVRSLLEPRYDRDVIDAYDPDWPPVVKYLTKTYSAILLYERYSVVDVERNKVIRDTLNRAMMEYQMIITNGDLYDTTGTKVPTLVDPLRLTDSESDDYNGLKDLGELYENGRTY